MENVNFDRELLELSAKVHYNTMRGDETRCKRRMHRWINIYYTRENNRNLFEVWDMDGYTSVAFKYTTCNKLIDLMPDENIADKFATAKDFAAYVTKYVEDNYNKLTAA